ncbi:MAG: hypothetical protein AB7L90_00785 [Hyphomicrobiaceae bacterium]
MISSPNAKHSTGGGAASGASELLEGPISSDELESVDMTFIEAGDTQIAAA